LRFITVADRRRCSAENARRPSVLPFARYCNTMHYDDYDYGYYNERFNRSTQTYYWTTDTKKWATFICGKFTLITLMRLSCRQMPSTVKLCSHLWHNSTVELDWVASTNWPLLSSVLFLPF